MIIAEIGQNWVGNPCLAKVLIMLAKENGADLVKFQLYDEVKVYGSKGHSEVSRGQAVDFFGYGEQIGIEVFFSVADVERVKWCEEIGVKRYKIAYSQNKNLFLAQSVRGTNKPVFVSTNNSKENDFLPQFTGDFTPLYRLYCIPQYPAEVKFVFDGVSLNWNYYAGFSDHTIGLDAAKIALSRGAWIIEKHFCINHHTGVDAEWSMTPDELKELVRFSKVVEEVL